MKDLINSTANWLTSDHSLTLTGWQWIAALPLSAGILIALVLICVSLAFYAAARTIRW